MRMRMKALRTILAVKHQQLRFSSSSCSAVNIIGFPVSAGQPKKGTELGPSVIRASGLRQKLVRTGWSNVRDSGDLMVDSLVDTHSDMFSVAKNAGRVSAACNLLSQAVCDSVRRYEQTVVLGGDHCLGMGSVHGHAMAEDQGRDLAVLWIDAHADIHTEGSSSSKNMHGMPVSFLLRELYSQHSFHWIKPVISAKNLAYIGLRDVDDEEHDFLRKLSPEVTVFTAADVRRMGAKHVILKALDKINRNNDLPIHVSFDIDVIDPKICGSTGTPVPFGIEAEDAYIFAEQVSRTGRLRVIDMVEVNPLIGNDDSIKQTASIASEILSAFCDSSSCRIDMQLQ